MADHRAIMAVGEAIVNLLRASYDPSDFNGQLEFKVITSNQYRDPQIQRGASLFLYRVYPNGVHRTPPGRVQGNGRLQTVLPLDLHFLLTVWGQEATLQHSLLGWILRTIEDTPILPANVLNSFVPDVFGPEETVEIGFAEMRTEDLLRYWEVLNLGIYQLSVPYLARIVRIESEQVLTEGTRPIQERRLRMARPGEPT